MEYNIFINKPDKNKSSMKCYKIGINFNNFIRGFEKCLVEEDD